MRVYYCTNFDGYWPVGTAAIVVAKSPHKAALLLESTLEGISLGQSIDEKDMHLVGTKEENVLILRDGNY